MLLVDKYRVKSRNDIVFHQDIYNRLLDVKTDEMIGETFIEQCSNELIAIDELKKKKFSRISNILVHGHLKTTLVNLLLQELYGNEVLNTELVSYNIEGYGAKGKTIYVEQSPYHIVINPNGTGLDKYVVQEVIKEYASTDFFQTDRTRVPFKIILIKNADNLAGHAQTSLRRTMEIYYKTCRFILCATQSSKIIEPLRSRCSLIRLSKPTDNELISFIALVAQKENIIIDYAKIKYIVSKSNRNVNVCLWWLQHYIYGVNDFNIAWKTYLKQIIDIFNYVYKNKKIVKQAGIMQLRSTINKLLLTEISCNEIMNEMLRQLITLHPEYGYNLHALIIETFYDYDKKISLGTRHIIHIETMFIHLCKILYDNSCKK